MNNKYVVVIGGANIDVGGSPYGPLVPEDSNPGRIDMSFGGVGRNIAHNLVNLGIDVKLITAVGNDFLGRRLTEYCINAGIDTSMFITSNSFSTSMYMYINDERGDMKLALSDMDICDLITPEYIDSCADTIRGASAVVADCNLSHDVMMHIKEISTAPVFIDTVSYNKAYKIKGDMDGIYAVKPNRIEAEYLTDMKIDSLDDCAAAAMKLIDQGAEKVFLTMASDGILAADIDEMYIIDNYDTDIVSTTGAGDSSTAAIVWAYLNKNSENYLIFASKAANMAASMTMNVKESINNAINEEKIKEKINNSYIQVKKMK